VCLLRGQDVQSPASGHRFLAIVDAQLVINIAGVRLDGGQRDEQPAADLAIRQIFRQQVEYFQLAGAQRLDEGLSGCAPGARSRAKGGQQASGISGRNAPHCCLLQQAERRLAGVQELPHVTFRLAQV